MSPRRAAYGNLQDLLGEVLPAHDRFPVHQDYPWAGRRPIIYSTDQEVGAVPAVSPRSYLMASRPTSRTPDGGGALLPMRAALILVLAVLTGAAVAGLLLLDGRSIAAAVLAGLGALAAGIMFFHWLVS
jgi:hypothetical protein